MAAATARCPASVPRFSAQRNPDPGTNRKRQRRVAKRFGIALAQKVLDRGVDLKVAVQLESSAQIQPLIGRIQVAVGQVASQRPSSRCLTAHRLLHFVSKTIEVFEYVVAQVYASALTKISNTSYACCGVFPSLNAFGKLKIASARSANTVDARSRSGCNFRGPVGNFPP